MLNTELKVVYNAIDEKFGYDVVMLDINNHTTVADYFVIATANNPNQLKAIADAVEGALHNNGTRMVSREGEPASRWVLLNFGVIIVHLFCKAERENYDLEGLWKGAAVILPEAIA
jgi:ribosome-associated protein